MKTQAAQPWVKATERGQWFAPRHDCKTHFDVTPSLWQFVCSARFGEARPCSFGNAKWTGDSYRYDIFRKGHQLALRWCNGSGEGWILCDPVERRDVANLLEVIINEPDESRRWDFCHFLYETVSRTASAANVDTAEKYSNAFVQGRLKKRKIRGKDAYNVEITPQGIGIE